MLPTARTQLWSREDQAEFLAAADSRLHLAFMLLLYRTQRLSDVLAMTKGQVYERDGRMMIELRQQKTGTLVAVPAHRDLLPLLHARLEERSGGMLLVPSPTGRPCLRRNFSRKWTRRCVAWHCDEPAPYSAKAGRKIACAPGSPSSTASGAISGHKIDFCQQIIDTYLPRRTEVAIAATSAWEAAEDAHGQAPAACACETQGHRSVPGF